MHDPRPRAPAPCARGPAAVLWRGSHGRLSVRIHRHDQPPTAIPDGHDAGEYFVSEEAARRGVAGANRSRCEPCVIPKHFGPNYPDVPK